VLFLWYCGDHLGNLFSNIKPSHTSDQKIKDSGKIVPVFGDKAIEFGDFLID